MTNPRVTSLWIYPVKSCRGIKVQQLEFTSTGIKYDRQWMIIDEKNEFLTLRSEPRLALIKTVIDLTNLVLSFDPHTFKINLSAECKKIATVKVWEDGFSAGIESDAINSALTEFLGKAVRLVRYQSESFRDLALASTALVKQVMFADSRPVLLVNESSLQDLNLKLAALRLPPAQIERFRPNIMIDGIAAFDEDRFLEMKINEIDFLNPKLCSRCAIITKDIETGEIVSKETLVVLSKYRKFNENKVMFGVYWTPDTSGVLNVQDLLSYRTF